MTHRNQTTWNYFDAHCSHSCGFQGVLGSRRVSSETGVRSKGGGGGTGRANGDLTWYNLKKVSSWFIRISCELVDLASLQRYTALKQRERGVQIYGWSRCHHSSFHSLFFFFNFSLFLTRFTFCPFYRGIPGVSSLYSFEQSFYTEMEILKSAMSCAMFDFTCFALTSIQVAFVCRNESRFLLINSPLMLLFVSH